MSRRFLLLLSCLFAAFLPLVAPAETTAGGLSDDGRAGVVLAVQGNALVRPAGRFRWTPLSDRSVVFPGDLIRTDALGAHALEVQLAKGGKLLLGPGSVLELPMKGGVRLMRGAIEARTDEKQPIDLSAPGSWRKEVRGTAWLTSGGEATKVHDEQPKWITGYRASAGDEWMGSLLATIDGREVPLAVGYHKVGVEIRDQIARTTVEQSFVNSTDDVLEGVFYFPLPADASISGFGMWIGGELVEADIVEKQRARQIYEDILRRKKDPGLLEWEGGNIFKARVYPINPHAEKRIRIRYTQVLPLEGSTYRYRYALRSELLQTKPLRQLDMSVKVLSERPLAEVSSPTHEIRLQKTNETAVATFTAQEYSPTKDFELAVTLSGTTPVTAVPHRRGDDGYLMVQLGAPDEGAGGWQRDLMPEGDPLDILFVADTSGSMDPTARRMQAAFMRSVLSLLGEKDTFRLLAFDTAPTWIVGERLHTHEEIVTNALERLGARKSLGWSDLDAGFKAALGAADEGTTVVYIGDGIGTTGDADPVALAGRLRALGAKTQATVHAVAPTSKYETPVLDALATIGGGSTRRIGVSAAQTAYGLLSEVARPAVKDLRVSIEGLRTARVYPDVLPNLPAGQQHVVLGRFLPSDKAQTARIVMTGNLSGKPVRYSTEVTIPAADVGNSFIPRLWARKHLDGLLAQGKTAAIKQEIIEFSERFGIMTPYTSFLVLESDADRERYGVERRVSMRDGERFFADAADKARLEARRAALKQAGTWRLGLRRTMLQEIARLGRDLPIPYPQPPVFFDERTTVYAASLEGPATNSAIGIGGGAGGRFRGPGGGVAPGMRDPSDPYLAEAGEMDKGGLQLGEKRLDSMRRNMETATRSGGELKEELRSLRGAMDADAPPPPGSPAPQPSMDAGSEWGPADGKAKKGESVEDFEEDETEFTPAEKPMAASKRPAARKSRFADRSLGGRMEQSYGYAQGRMPHHRYIGDLGAYLVYRYPDRPAPVITLGVLGWPGVPPAPDPAKLPKPESPDWTPEVRALLNATWRRPLLTDGKGAFHFVYEGSRLHATRGTPMSVERHELWARQDAWYGVSGGYGHQPFESWVHDGKRGNHATAFRLARTRDAKPLDAGDWNFPISSLGRYAPDTMWKNHTARELSRDGDLVTLAIKAPGVHEHETHLVIDSKRGIMVELRNLRAGKVRSRTTWTKPVQAGGAWWPTITERRDAEDRITWRATLTIEAIDAGVVDTVAAKGKTARANAITIDGKLPSVDDSKQARHDREASFVHELILAIHFAQTQQWDPMWTHWTAAAASLEGKPGRRFVKSRLMQRSRRGEEFKKHLAETAAYVSGLKDATQAAFLAPYLHSLSSGIFGWNEQVESLRRFKKAWIQPDAPYHELRRKAWMSLLSGALANSGLREEAQVLRRRMAELYPHDVVIQTARSADLWDQGRRTEALDHLESVLSKREPWLESEREHLYVTLTDRLWQGRYMDRLQAALTVWMSGEPKQRTVYQRFLSFLYLRGKMSEADHMVTNLIQKSLTADSSDSDWRRQEAAVQLALGAGWHFNIRHVEKMWWTPLEELVLRYARADLKRGTPAGTLMSDWRFQRTQAWRNVRAALQKDLTAADAVATYSLQRLAFYLRWIPWDRRNANPELWRQTVDGLKARYDATEKGNDKEVLAGHVLRLLDAHGETDEALDFLRARMKAAPEKKKHTFAVQIWDRQMRRPYDAARESEVFRLLAALPGPELSDEARRSVFASRVRQLADRVYSWHREDHMGEPASRKDLTRAALKALGKAASTHGRRMVASRFKAAALDAPEASREWLQIERIAYAAQVGENLDSVTAEAQGILLRDWAADGNPLDRILRERAAVVLTYAASRRGAPAERVDAALDVFAKGATAQDAVLAGDKEAYKLMDWRYQTFRLLVALDRVEPLEKTLAAWIVPSKVESRWRIALGYIQAETGRLAPATRQFEAVESADELGAHEYQVLADWYLVLDEDAKREKALEGRYEKTDEWALANLLSRHARRTSRSAGVPEDLDPEALRLMRILMRKSQWPANHIWRIQGLYRQLKDFRLLESMVDGLTGHTKEGIYNFLTQFRTITNQIHEEATCDAIVKRINTLLAGDDISALDRRALRLFVALVEERASRVKETDPGHEKRAFEALRGAYQGEWQKGERKLMADFLGAIRFTKGGAMMREQMRQLAELVEQEPTDSAMRIWMTQAWSNAYWGYGMHDEAIAALTEGLRLERRRTNGLLTSHADGPFNTLINRLESRRRYRDAEAFVMAELKARKLPSRIRAMENKLLHVYSNALYHGASVSVGSGEALYDAATARVLGAIDADVTRARSLIQTFAYLHVAANHSRAIPDAGQRLRSWIKDTAPGLMERLPLSAHNMMGNLADNLRRLLGPVAGLEALLDHKDRESAWIARIGYHTWRQQNYRLARWRYEASTPLGDLEPRLWAMVAAGVERKLVVGDNTGSYFWTPRNKWYWGARRADYGTIAMRVFELEESTPAVLNRVAHFQRSLNYRREAIASLRRALEREKADVGMRWTLVRWLHADGRNAEALPLVDALVAEHPSNISYWRMKVDVLARLSNRREDMALTLKQAEAWFRENDRWRERIAAGLGEEAVQHRFSAEGVRLYQEAIELRIAARKYKGGRDTTLARYYRILAQGLGGLGKTVEAIQSVSASLVAGSRSRRERDRTIKALESTLFNAKDLDEWAAAYEAEVEKTGLDATPLRKALAKAYTRKGKHAQALAHLLAARDVDPRDADVHKGIVAAYDKLGDNAKAIEALFGSIRLAPHNLDAYEDLATRYGATGKQEAAERAITTMVEITPHDSAGHQRLAEIRVSQKRLPEAAVQWRQVVRTRSLEPTGYLGLARVLIELGQREEARAQIDHLLKTTWHSRFGDVKSEAASLLRRLQGE